MNNIVGHIVFAKGDVNLVSENGISSITIAFSLSAHRSHIATGIWLREIHRPRPFTGHHLGEISHLLDFGSVMDDRVNGSLRQSQRHGKSHIASVHNFLDRDTDHPRESTATKTLITWNCSPTSIHKVPISLSKTRRHGDRMISI